MTKTIDSFETYYKLHKTNEKAPIIFIHGIGLTHEIWDRQIKFFTKYNTIVYDLIGHGKTPIKKREIRIMDRWVKTGACQCFFTNFQASDDE